MTTEQQAFERVEAKDLQPGDEFAEARTHNLYRLESIVSIGEKSRYLEVSWERPDRERGSGRVRPRHTTKFWRVVS